MIPAVLGILFHLRGKLYSPVYSFLLVLWSIGFVEWWRVRERIIAMRNGTRGSFRVEKRRAQYHEGFPWWMREIRMATSVPVILLFIVVLLTLLTAIFVFEAFVTRLYTGPGHKFIVRSFFPVSLGSYMHSFHSLSAPLFCSLSLSHACWLSIMRRLLVSPSGRITHTNPHTMPLSLSKPSPSPLS